MINACIIAEVKTGENLLKDHCLKYNNFTAVHGCLGLMPSVFPFHYFHLVDRTNILSVTHYRFR